MRALLAAFGAALAVGAWGAGPHDATYRGLIDRLDSARIRTTYETVEAFGSRLAGSRGEAATLAWVCSGECSFTTGGVFDISGGRSVY